MPGTDEGIRRPSLSIGQAAVGMQLLCKRLDTGFVTERGAQEGHMPVKCSRAGFAPSQCLHSRVRKREGGGGC